jgi:hypothetical protein
MTRRFAYDFMFWDENTLIFLGAIATTFRTLVDYQILSDQFHLATPAVFLHLATVGFFGAVQTGASLLSF